MGSDTQETNNVRECGFSNTKSQGSSHMCEANFLVPSITMYSTICGVYCEIIPDEEIKNKGKNKLITKLSLVVVYKFLQKIDLL
jgi:uncharacterized Fe-S radical SAM superfamily protein PflX